MNLTRWLSHNRKDLAFFAGLVAGTVAICLVGTNSPISEIVTIWRWILIIMTLMVLLASWLITGNPLFGWLINEQNSMSLSRLQLFLWTVVVLSALVTAVLANLRFNHFEQAVAIALPQEVWLAMGISTASLVGSNLILDNKKVKRPKEPAMRRILGLEADAALPETVGTLAKKKKPSLLDLVRGEEVGNESRIDLTRLQNLLFTLVLVGVYAASLNAMFISAVSVAAPGKTIADNFPLTQFPQLGSSAIALLTISHAGYLVAKTIDKQPTEV